MSKEWREMTQLERYEYATEVVAKLAQAGPGTYAVAAWPVVAKSYVRRLLVVDHGLCAFIPRGVDEFTIEDIRPYLNR